MHNTIVAAGYLVTDPELRTTTGGNTVCKMRLCISDSRAKNPCFIDAEVWNKQAEIAGEYLKKGRRIILTGELCQNSWEKDGQKYYKYFIRGEGFKFISNDKKEGEDETSSETPNPPSNKSNDVDDDIPF